MMEAIKRIELKQAGACHSLATFLETETPSILQSLVGYVPDAGESQKRAWRDSIRVLKQVLDTYVSTNPKEAEAASVILEYTIPLESRRIDALLLLNGVVVVVEFKGKRDASQGDIDQAIGYARDLRAYHRMCTLLPVKCVLLLTRASGEVACSQDISILSPEQLAAHLNTLSGDTANVLSASEFIDLDCYQPLPSLIKAARELFSSGSIKRIHRAAVATEPTLQTCSEIVHYSAQNKRRSLILICGVPGAGKTLVGLQLAHAKYLDDLAVDRGNGERAPSSAVFLSGNGPLVEVLQYELKSAGGDGKAFVRGVHEYIKTYTRNNRKVPPHHVLIYDEAQRAFDAEQVDAKHRDMPAEFKDLSEPELFIQFAERVPEWSVVVGLIGSGQEIHIGEEGGVVQWNDAIHRAQLSRDWDVYLPEIKEIESQFMELEPKTVPPLELSVTIRFHLATMLYSFVEHFLAGHSELARTACDELEKHGYHFRLTHDLEKAKAYLRERYKDQPTARFGLVASARDKELSNHGIPKGFKSPGEVSAGKYGRWYAEPFGEAGSCTGLDTVATEFASQGLELDACLLAWGTDLIRKNNEWSIQYASKYRDAHRIKDAKTLRVNAYRVLLTRGRDGCVIFIPPIPDKMRETFKYFRDCGFRELSIHDG